MYERIKKFYNLKLWTEDMVKDAVKKDVITEEECNEILGIIETEKVVTEDIQ